MDEEIDRARLRGQVWRYKRHLFNRNEGVGELRRLSEEELQQRDAAVAVRIERMEELTANLARQREQMKTLNENLNRLMRITVFAILVSVLVRRVRP